MTYRYDSGLRSHYPLYYLNRAFVEAVRRRSLDDFPKCRFRTVCDVRLTYQEKGDTMLWPMKPQTQRELERIATAIGFDGPVYGSPVPCSEVRP